MKSGDFRISVECLQAGQPRPYADSIYEYIMFCEWIPYGKTDFEPVQWMDSVVLHYAKGFWRFKTKEEKADWSERSLEEFKKIGDGKWQIKMREIFTD